MLSDSTLVPESLLETVKLLQNWPKKRKVEAVEELTVTAIPNNERNCLYHLAIVKSKFNLDDSRTKWSSKWTKLPLEEVEFQLHGLEKKRKYAVQFLSQAELDDLDLEISILKKIVKLKKNSRIPSTEVRELFHAFYDGNEPHKLDFTHPKSNYGLMLDKVERVNWFAIPCLLAQKNSEGSGEASSICNMKHLDKNKCQKVYLAWLEFESDYKAISGEIFDRRANGSNPRLGIPHRSIVDQMYSYDWKDRKSGPSSE